MEFFISHKNIEAVVFAKSRKNSCSFFALDVIQKGRSPPLDFDFQNSEVREMGEHPKRRKDKYNPYRISENDGRYYILFKDGQEQINELEISRELYEAFNTFELEGARVIMLNITKTCCARMDFQILHFINSKVHIQPFC